MCSPLKKKEKKILVLGRLFSASCYFHFLLISTKEFLKYNFKVEVLGAKHCPHLLVYHSPEPWRGVTENEGRVHLDCDDSSMKADS